MGWTALHGVVAFDHDSELFAGEAECFGGDVFFACEAVDVG